MRGLVSYSTKSESEREGKGRGWQLWLSAYDCHKIQLTYKGCNNHQAAIAARVEDFVSFRLENLYAPQCPRKSRSLSGDAFNGDVNVPVPHERSAEGATIRQTGAETVDSMLYMANLDHCQLTLPVIADEPGARS